MHVTSAMPEACHPSRHLTLLQNVPLHADGTLEGYGWGRVVSMLVRGRPELFPGTCAPPAFSLFPHHSLLLDEWILQQ